MARKSYVAKQIALGFLALILPPAAVAIVEGCDTDVAINLLLLILAWPTACIHALVVVCYYAAKPNKLTPRAQRHAYQTYMSGMPDSTQAQTSSTVRVPKGTGIESYNQRPQEQYGQPHRIDPAAYAEHYNYDDDTLEAIEVVDFAEEDKKYI